DDAGDAAGPRSVSIDAGQITGLAPAPIAYVQLGLASLAINGGSQGNQFTVHGTPSNPEAQLHGFALTTTLNCGAGNDNVTVLGVSDPLAVYGQAGNDTVFIGGGAPHEPYDTGFHVDGGVGTNTLVGPDIDSDVRINDWRITGANAGLLNFVGS